jgi:hypothetical protein
MDYTETHQYVVQSIRDFLDGTGGDWDWGDFISLRLDYADLDEVRKFCLGLPYDYPPQNKVEYCSEQGIEALRQKFSELIGAAR